VQQEVLRRIHARTWKPGDLIPAEAELAAEFGCARATVNRALRSLADAGLLNRKRKAGTRVALQPAARATLTIPLIRQEIEDQGRDYGYRLLQSQVKTPPAPVLAAMDVLESPAMMHLTALHMANGAPHALEDRWINLDTVPDASNAPFDRISANEWLIANVPYTHGEISFSAAQASPTQSAALGCSTGDALFIVDRITWDHEDAVTSLRLAYGPGHRMRTGL
jgi:GntR family histidine utilization transcriptional repressor